MSIWKKIILFFVVAAVPFSYITIPFVSGYCFLSDASVLLVLPCFLFGPPIAGFITGRLIPTTTWRQTIIGVVTMFLLWASYFLFPGGMAGLEFGMSANFRLRTNPEQVQQWASHVVDQFEDGRLGTTDNGAGFFGKAALKDSDIPAQIKNMWPLRPTIGIATISDNGWIMESLRTNIVIMPQLTGGQRVPLHLSHCVVISWYEGHRGFLVGHKDFESKWDPSRGGEGLIYHIMPGIYAFSFER